LFRNVVVYDTDNLEAHRFRETMGCFHHLAGAVENNAPGASSLEFTQGGSDPPLHQAQTPEEPPVVVVT